MTFKRFIPTYVGHTYDPLHQYNLIYGSSPHTWGILDVFLHARGDSRFIPTYVGHTRNR